jgi:transcription elongation factor GreB
VDAPPSDRSRVFFGAYVTVEDEDGEAATFRIVGSDEFDVDNGWISMDAPVAKALLGKREGDEVMVRRPKGEIVYTIVTVAYRDD